MGSGSRVCVGRCSVSLGEEGGGGGVTWDGISVQETKSATRKPNTNTRTPEHTHVQSRSLSTGASAEEEAGRRNTTLLYKLQTRAWGADECTISGSHRAWHRRERGGDGDGGNATKHQNPTRTTLTIVHVHNLRRTSRDTDTTARHCNGDRDDDGVGARH